MHIVPIMSGKCRIMKGPHNEGSHIMNGTGQQRSAQVMQRVGAVTILYLPHMQRVCNGSVPTERACKGFVKYKANTGKKEGWVFPPHVGTFPLFYL